MAADEQTIDAMRMVQKMLGEEFQNRFVPPGEPPARLPEYEGPGLLRSFGNAIAEGAVPGFVPFGTPASESRVNPFSLPQDQQKAFYDLPRQTQLLLATERPEALAPIFENKNISDLLFTKPLGPVEIATNQLLEYAKNAPDDAKGEIYANLFDLAEQNSVLPPGTAQQYSARRAAGDFADKDVGDLLRAAMDTRLTPEQRAFTMTQIGERIELSRREKEQGIAQSRASEFASRGSGASAFATAAKTRLGQLYAFPDGKTMRESDPEFLSRLARGETPVEIGRMSGTEGGAASVIGKGTQGRAQEELSKYAGQLGMIEQWAQDVEASPGVVGAGGRVTAAIADPIASFAPGFANFITSSATGRPYREFTDIRNQIGLYQARAVRPIVMEGRFTDPERKMSALNSGEANDPAISLTVKAGNMWAQTLLNIDKQTYLGSGGMGFGYDLTGPDRVAVAQELDARMKRFGFSDEKKNRVKELLLEQQSQLRKLSLDRVADLYGGNLADDLNEKASRYSPKE